ncbi:hypothetical protein V6N11_065866 [Hibiscus sabdariffa]|uniref:Uncharacterized protein n=1 Tax=Hibiscus sabdariffa TaxID=183260 RepID=A0ABR2PIP5_9ROSI
MSIHRSDAGKGFVDYGEVLAFQSPAILSGDRLPVLPNSDPKASKSDLKLVRETIATVHLLSHPSVFSGF